MGDVFFPFGPAGTFALKKRRLRRIPDEFHASETVLGHVPPHCIHLMSRDAHSVTGGDWLRYGEKGSGECEYEVVPKQASERRPIVVWNITRACNLKCVHCYNDSGSDKACNEVTTDEAKAVLDDLARFKVLNFKIQG